MQTARTPEENCRHLRYLRVLVWSCAKRARNIVCGRMIHAEKCRVENYHTGILARQNTVEVQSRQLPARPNWTYTYTGEKQRTSRLQKVQDARDNEVRHPESRVATTTPHHKNCTVPPRKGLHGEWRTPNRNRVIGLLDVWFSVRCLPPAWSFQKKKRNNFWSANALSKTCTKTHRATFDI